MDDLYYSGNPDLSYEDRAKYPLYRHVAKTYGWMFLGLLLTFTTASLLYIGLASGMTILYPLYGKVGSIVTLVAQLGLVVYFPPALPNILLPPLRLFLSPIPS